MHRRMAALALSFVMLALPHSARAAATPMVSTDQRGIESNSTLHGGDLPRPLFGATATAVGATQTRYEVHGRTVAPIVNAVGTSTVCHWTHPGRTQRLSLREQHQYDASPGSRVSKDKFNVVVSYRTKPGNAWKQLASYGENLSGTFDPMLERTVWLNGSLVTDAGAKATALWVRIQSHTAISNTVLHFAQIFDVACG